MKIEGMACDECHTFREDGSFAGIPTTEECAECHAEVMGEDPAEAKFVEEYVNEDREVPCLSIRNSQTMCFSPTLRIRILTVLPVILM